MALNEELEKLFYPVFEEMGFDIVRLHLSGGESRKTLQIMAEHKDRSPMTVEDCASLSRAISPLLDEHDPIKENYTLEVSSPGLDRPLVKLADFDRFKGFEAKVESSVPVNGRKRFSGRLIGTDGNDIVLTFEGQEVKISYPDIVKAKLILTDELIKAFAPADDE